MEKEMKQLTESKDIETMLSCKKEEKIKKIENFIAKDNLLELKEKIKVKVRYKFIIPLRKNNIENIDRLYKEKNDKLPKESVNLLNQTYMTIKNVHKLIKNKSLVDSNTLIRSAFENLIMGMMIYFDQNVYDEFKKLGLKEEERVFTKQQKLRNMFKAKLKIIDKLMFEDISNRKIQEMLDEYYDKLCLFTHSTLIVNKMVEVYLNSDEEFFLIIAKQNIYFLEVLLNCCLKFISKDKSNNIRYDYLFISWIILFYDIDKEKYTKEYLSKYKGLLYENINEEYLNKNNRAVSLIQEEIKKLNDVVKNNPVAVIDILENFLK